MIDRIDLFVPDGGPAGLGFMRGSKDSRPEEWFFKAHFYQDPVCPARWGWNRSSSCSKFAAREALAGNSPVRTASRRRPEHPHRWTYRGQILPQNRTVTVEAVVSQVTESPHPDCTPTAASRWTDAPSIA